MARRGVRDAIGMCVFESRKRFSMVSDQVGDHFLLMVVQADQAIGLENVITMPVVVDGVNKMADVVQQRAYLEQQSFLLAQAVKGL